MTTQRITVFAVLKFLRVVFVFCLLAAFVLIWLRVMPKTVGYDNKRAVIREKLLRDLRADDDKKLNSYEWVDQTKQVVRIPVDRAMELVVSELAGKKEQPSAVKVEVPYPAGLQQQPAPVTNPEVKK